MAVDSEGGIVSSTAPSSPVVARDGAAPELGPRATCASRRTPWTPSERHVIDEDAPAGLSPQGQLLATIGAQDLHKPKAPTVDGGRRPGVRREGAADPEVWRAGARGGWRSA
jgi:hypothetical protein